MRRPRFRTCSFFVPLLALSISARAQDEIPTKVNNQNRTGDLPFSTSVGTDIERVDIAIGNLIVRIPLVSIPGRGMEFNFFFRYDAMYWTAAKRLPREREKAGRSPAGEPGALETFSAIVAESSAAQRRCRRGKAMRKSHEVGG